MKGSVLRNTDQYSVVINGKRKKGEKRKIVLCNHEAESKAERNSEALEKTQTSRAPQSCARKIKKNSK